MTHWMTLGIEPTENKKDVKKAYAKLLKVTKPDDDPTAYQTLREAFDWAIGYCDYMAARQDKTTEVEQQTKKENTHPISDNSDNSAFFPNRLPLENDENEHQENEQEQQKKVSQERRESHKTSKDSLEQEDPYQSALNLVKTIFSAGSDEQAVEVFQSILNNNELLNLQTRAYFEEISLNTLLQSSQNKLYYELLDAIAAEFLWFDERQNNAAKANNINYLKRRLDVNYQYKHTLASKIHSPDFGEKNVASLLTGSYKPKYFHLLRFIGTYNRKIRKTVNFFKPAVDRKLCPELDTDTFAWWDKHLQPSLYSLWHCLAGVLLTFILMLNIRTTSMTGSVLDALLPYILISVAIVSSLLFWGGDRIYRRYFHHVRSRWDKVKGSYKADVTLSMTYILSVWCWSTHREFWYLPFIAIGAVILLFGLRCLPFLFINFVVVAVFFADLSGADRAHSQHIVWIIIFISHKFFIQSMMKMPQKVSDFIRRSHFISWIYQGIMTSALSYLYLLFLAL